MEETLIKKVHQQSFLYDTKSPDYRYQHMRPNAWEGIGKELKIKPKFYVSSCDVRIVCPRLNRLPWSRCGRVCPSVDNFKFLYTKHHFSTVSSSGPTSTLVLQRNCLRFKKQSSTACHDYVPFQK
jgi:hypothetical protein